MLLADIGNSRVHIYNGEKVVHLTHKEAIERYGDRELLYITVKGQLKSQLTSLKGWIDISDKIVLNGAYSTMGVDRKALCSSHESGIFISAGTAITVDIVEKGKYQGGFLLLGLKQYLEGYANISPALKTTLNRDINLEKLPKSTRDGISYGILAPIKCIVEKYRMDKRVYISGGDGRFLSSHFQNAIFDEKLIFLGIKRNLMGSNFSNYLLKIS